VNASEASDISRSKALRTKPTAKWRKCEAAGGIREVSDAIAKADLPAFAL
jgi:hypothetical protein